MTAGTGFSLCGFVYKWLYAEKLIGAWCVYQGSDSCDRSKGNKWYSHKFCGFYVAALKYKTAKAYDKHKVYYCGCALVENFKGFLWDVGGFMGYTGIYLSKFTAMIIVKIKFHKTNYLSGSDSLEKRKRLSKSTVATLIALSVIMLINIVSWISTAAVDFYADHIFPQISAVLSAVSGALPFSLGEVMIAAGIVLLIAAPFLFAYFIMHKKIKVVKLLRNIYCWILVFILASETLNCFILYHTTEFSQRYHNSAGAEGFTEDQLYDLLERLIYRANKLEEGVRRDDAGNVVIPDGLDEIAEAAMNTLAEEYPALGGTYPQHKVIHFSSVMTRFSLQGIYFPFSLEANVNSQLSNARTPCTVMHELSHLKGFIREDEASFIAYRACMVSGVAEVEYSGLLSAINYLYSELKETSPERAYELAAKLSPNVRGDNYFVSDEVRQQIENKVIIPSEVTKAVSDAAIDTTLKLNGIDDGKKSYGRMVTLLLEYHYCCEGQ